MEPRALFEIAALPFLWPTRLADGLELEVFYVAPITEPHDSPRLRTRAKLWFPRVVWRLLAQQLRQTLSCQRRRSYSRNLCEAT
jgi:hypothetical protein